MGGQISTALQQNCTALQDSDSSTSPLLIIIPTRLSLQQGGEVREGNHLQAWLESMVWLSEQRAGTHSSGSCLLWSFSEGQCGWCPKDNAWGQALQGWAPQYERDVEILEWVQQRAIKDGSIWHSRTGWESWDCSAFKKRRSGRILSLYINIWQENAKKTKTDSSQWCPLRGQWAQSGKQEMPF